MTDFEPLSKQAINRLTANTEPWLSCDDCFDRIDVVVDAVLDSATPMAEEFRVHLLCCPACHEEARSLAAIVASEHGLSQDQAVARLDAATYDTSA